MIIDGVDYRIAIVGEAPGEDEENYRRPFVGASGQFLTNIMRNEAGINRQACLDWQRLPAPASAERDQPVSTGTARRFKMASTELAHDIARFDPHLCVLSGNTPLRAAVGAHCQD